METYKEAMERASRPAEHVGGFSHVDQAGLERAKVEMLDKMAAQLTQRDITREVNSLKGLSNQMKCPEPPAAMKMALDLISNSIRVLSERLDILSSKLQPILKMDQKFSQGAPCANRGDSSVISNLIFEKSGQIDNLAMLVSDIISAVDL